jgi:hypothetical protein
MIQFIKKRLARISPKQLAIVAGFTVAMFGAVALGLSTKQLTSAASVRDTDRGNSIMNDGSIGCLTLSECVSDIKANKPGDLQTIYANRGLSPSEIDRFAQTAKAGKVYKDGRIVVDGQVVATGAWSMGRETWGNQRQPLDINGKRYYMSATTASFAADSIDAFVMFNANGEVEFALLTACGNPTWGNSVKPEYSCKMLNQRAVEGELNTYEFNTTVGTMKNASVNKVVYNFGDGTPEITKTNPSEFVRHTFTKSAEVSVTVYFNLPGGKVATAQVVANCKKKITFIAPFYSCDIVLPRELNETKTKFRFTVKASAGNGATLKDADFTLDGNSTVTGVTTKDEAGNIYKEYEFTRDGKEHTVAVKVNFNLADGVQSKTCEAKVTSGKTPNCTVPGKEHLPVGHPECKPDEKCTFPGKEHLPKNHPDCGEVLPAELPKTGMGGVVGLFAGTSVLGAVAHRVFMSRRQR